MQSEHQQADTTANRVDLVVGANLRNRRKALNISQTVLGEVLGVTFQQVQKYETGSNRISAPMLYKAARRLRCSIIDFYAGVDDAVDAGTPADLPQAENVIDEAIALERRHPGLLSDLSRLSDKHVGHLANIAGAIVRPAAIALQVA